MGGEKEREGGREGELEQDRQRERERETVSVNSHTQMAWRTLQHINNSAEASTVPGGNALLHNHTPTTGTAGEKNGVVPVD